MEEMIDGHMGLDEILNLIGGENPYHKLNMILFSLQEKGVISFDEDALDRLNNEVEY